MYDFHVHNRISFDASPEATLVAYCEQALRQGLDGFALTNHYDLGAMENGVFPMPDLDAEETELQEALARYAGRLRIFRGIELGQPYWLPEMAKKLLAARAYDVVLGSVHLLDGFRDFYDLPYGEMTDAEVRADWDAYLAALETMSRTVDYDVQTHILYPLRYVPSRRREAVTGLPACAKERYEPILRNLAERGIALEINTSCVRKAAMPEADPGLPLLRFFRELGGECVTFGSDAHAVCDLCADFAQAAELAQAAGFRYATVFCNREKTFLPIGRNTTI